MNMISNDMTIALIQQEVKNRYNRDITVTLSHHLENDLGLDSLDRIEMWLALEDKFRINIPETEAKQIQTVQDCVNLVEKYIK